MARERKTIICAGYARLPKSISPNQVHGVLGLELEVDPADGGKIIDAVCTTVPSLGEKFILELLVGYSLDEGIEPVVKEIRSRYFNVAQKAVISALEEAYRRYLEFKRLGVEEELKKLSILDLSED